MKHRTRTVEVQAYSLEEEYERMNENQYPSPPADMEEENERLTQEMKAMQETMERMNEQIERQRKTTRGTPIYPGREHSNSRSRRRNSMVIQTS